MDDFYVYYEPTPRDIMIGVIKAISPTKLSEMGDMDFIRVQSKVGLSFTTGSEPLNIWIVGWDADKKEMGLVKKQDDFSIEVIKFLMPIPTQQNKPKVIVTWKRKEKTFNVRTRGVTISHQNVNMIFFVTRIDDPNIIHHHFRASLYDTMNRKGIDFQCDIELPKRFTVYTKQDLDRYQLKVQ